MYDAANDETLLGVGVSPTPSPDKEVAGFTGGTDSDEGSSDEVTKSALPELIRQYLSMRAAHKHSQNDDMSDDDDDEDSEDEDEGDEEDEDEEDDDEDDDEDEDEEDDDEEECVPSKSKTVKTPVGKRVIIRSDYKSDRAYCEAVLKSMTASLRKQGIRAEPRAIRDDVRVFAFDRTTNGVDVDCHILCEYEICNFRIEFKFNVANQPGRAPLIDYFCQDKNFPLRYGSIIMDHNDGEKKIEYSSCFYGAFSEEAFLRYWEALDYTLKAYARDYEALASAKKLDADQRKLARKLLNDIATNLGGRVKPENEELFNRALELLGGNLSSKARKLLNYIIERKQ